MNKFTFLRDIICPDCNKLFDLRFYYDNTNTYQILCPYCNNLSSLNNGIISSWIHNSNNKKAQNLKLSNLKCPKCKNEMYITNEKGSNDLNDTIWVCNKCNNTIPCNSEETNNINLEHFSQLSNKLHMILGFSKKNVNLKYPWFKFGHYPFNWRKYYSSYDWLINIRKNVINNNEFCAICKIPINNQFAHFHIHHIVPINNGGNNCNNNLITLCCLCHSRLHKKKSIFFHNLLENPELYNYNIHNFTNRSLFLYNGSSRYDNSYGHIEFEKYEQIINIWTDDVVLTDIILHSYHKLLNSFLVKDEGSFFWELYRISSSFKTDIEEISSDTFMVKMGSIPLLIITLFSIMNFLKPLKGKGIFSEKILNLISLLKENIGEQDVLRTLDKLQFSDNSENSAIIYRNYYHFYEMKYFELDDKNRILLFYLIQSSVYKNFDIKSKIKNLELPKWESYIVNNVQNISIALKKNINVSLNNFSKLAEPQLMKRNNNICDFTTKDTYVVSEVIDDDVPF